MNIYISSLLILFSTYCFGQEQSEYDIAISKSIKCYQIKDFVNMNLYLIKAEKAISGKDSLTQKAQIFNNYGALKWKLGDYNLSISYYKKAIDIYTKNGNDSLKAGADYNLALALKNLEVYDLATDNFSSALLFYKANQDNKKIIKVYSALGNLFREKKDYEKAEEYQLLALEVSESLKDEKEVSRIFHNLGMLYNENGESEKAKYYLFEARKMKNKLGRGLASNSSQIGQYYLNKNDLDSAEYYFGNSLMELNNGANRSKLAIANWHMGDLHYRKKDYRLADEYLNFAFHIADSMKLSGSLSKILQSQIIIDKILNRTENLISKYELLLIENEKTWGIAEQKSIAGLNVKYETFQKDKEIQLKDNLLNIEQLENDRLTYRNLLLFIGVAATISIIMGLLWFYIKLKKSKETIEIKNVELNEKNEIVDSLHRELNHRTKNYYQMFAGMLKFDLKSTDDYDVQKVLKRYVSRVKAMSEIHRYLLSEKTILGTVKLNLYLSNLLSIIDIALNNNSTKINFQENFIDIDFDYDKALRLGITMNEIVSNSIEHGFIHHTSPSVIINMTTEANNLILTIKDNGIGFKTNVNKKTDPKKGVGIIKNILNSVNGHIKYQNDSTGTLVTILIPK